MQAGTFPGRVGAAIAPQMTALETRGRPARAGARSGPAIGTDDFSDLDDAEAALRLEWRKLVLGYLRPETLAD
jgi:hypothetical protein